MRILVAKSFIEVSEVCETSSNGEGVFGEGLEVRLGNGVSTELIV